MTTRAASTRSRRFHGFTLIELLIAIGLGIVIMLGLMLLFSRSSGNQQQLERTVRQFENARFALDTLNEDLMHAGFYSDFNPNTAIPSVAYTSPSPCAVAPSAMGWNAGTTPMQVPRPVELIAAGTAVTCLADRMAGTEAIVVRRAETGPTIPWTAGNGTNLYIQTARCGSEAGQIRVAAVPLTEPEKSFNLKRKDCELLGTNNALRRLSQRTYYVARCNDCAANDGIPTLKRVEMIDGALRTTAIAEGVENVQFELGVDSEPAPPNVDGVPDKWFTAKAAADDIAVDPDAKWRDNIVSVRVHLLTRSTQPERGYVETRTYQLGPDVEIKPASPAPDLQFKRTLLTTTVRLHNVGARRE